MPTERDAQAHRANRGERFDPRRTDLDHVAFALESMDELEDCATRLSEAGIDHSAIRPVSRFGHVIELHDPDGIQLELHMLPTATPDTKRALPSEPPR